MVDFLKGYDKIIAVVTQLRNTEIDKIQKQSNSNHWHNKIFRSNGEFSMEIVLKKPNSKDKGDYKYVSKLYRFSIPWDFF